MKLQYFYQIILLILPSIKISPNPLNVNSINNPRVSPLLLLLYSPSIFATIPWSATATADYTNLRRNTNKGRLPLLTTTIRNPFES